MIDDQHLSEGPEETLNAIVPPLHVVSNSTPTMSTSATSVASSSSSSKSAETTVLTNKSKGNRLQMLKFILIE